MAGGRCPLPLGCRLAGVESGQSGALFVKTDV